MGERRRPSVALVTLAVLAVVGVLAFVTATAARLGPWGSGAGASRGQALAAVDPETGLQSFPVGNRRQMPAVAGDTLDGGRLTLYDLRGHVVVVNVWGSWCAPCREEAPALARVARETEARGVRFVGIDTRDNADAARAFVRRFGIPYPSLVDQDGRVLLAFNGILPVSAVPSTLVIDRNGLIAARVVGKVTYNTLRGLVEDVLAEGGSPPPAGRS